MDTRPRRPCGDVLMVEMLLVVGALLDDVGVAGHTCAMPNRFVLRLIFPAENQ
jgi:hypothetical protein